MFTVLPGMTHQRLQLLGIKFNQLDNETIKSEPNPINNIHREKHKQSVKYSQMVCDILI